MQETKKKLQAPFFVSPCFHVLQIGSNKIGSGAWLDYASIKTREDMFFATMKCNQIPEKFRIIEHSSGKVIYGCGA